MICIDLRHSLAEFAEAGTKTVNGKVIKKLQFSDDALETEMSTESLNRQLFVTAF